jgi:hypothetical protein
MKRRRGEELARKVAYERCGAEVGVSVAWLACRQGAQVEVEACGGVVVGYPRAAGTLQKRSLIGSALRHRRLPSVFS